MKNGYGNLNKTAETDRRRKNSQLNHVQAEKTDGKTINKWFILVIINYGNQNLIKSFLNKRCEY